MKTRLFIIIIFLILLTGCNKSMSNLSNSPKEFTNIRKPAVAGQFYPGEASRLEFKINKYLKEVPDITTSPSPYEGEGGGEVGEVKAIMVPHAGYDFSGAVAAYGYKLLEGRKIDTVVIICNSHTTYFSGVAIDDSDAWETPLGQIEVNKELAEKLVNSSEAIRYNNEAHINDHTLEVQLPFLQTVLAGDFKIMPVLFGNMDKESYKELVSALKENLSDNDIIVISTDMSHYPDYEDANKVDKETLEMIKTGDINKLERHIAAVEEKNIPGEQTVLCGVDGVKTAMELYNLANGDFIEILKYANSGDVLIGDKDRVVGYGAIVFTQIQNEKAKMQNDNEKLKMNEILNKFQQKELLKIARETVEGFVRTGAKPEFRIADERFNWKEGSFVTLHKDGELRGCIGQIVPSEKPLHEVVRDMAIAACSEDHRFKPVSEKELQKIDYEVSVLSVPERIDNWRSIELGKHGVIIKKGFRGGVFLPQVATETGWGLDKFLSELCSQKSGLPPNCYKDKDTEILVFTAQVFSEDDVK